MARVAALFFTAVLLCGMAARPGPERLVDHGGYLVRCRGREVAALNPDAPLVPASTAKLVTALAALETLGPDFRFPTSFFLGRDGRLRIRGHGDPFMVSEEVRLVADELFARGVRRLRGIDIDTAMFALPRVPPWNGASLNPYDAVNSALAVNFNTVFVELEGGRVVSAEKQTPTLPLMAGFAARLEPGKPQRFNVTAEGAGLGREYARQLFAAILAERGIEVGPGPVPAAAASTPILVHRSSRRLEEVVRAMLLYSNNFIANQLFLFLGMKRYGPPATWDKGRRAMRAFLDKTLPADGSVRLVEGSGLSRQNRISCRGLVRILERFRPYAGLLPRKKGFLLKSGTMTGVYAYAGYLRGREAPFALILNQEENRRDALLQELAAALDHPCN